MRRDGEDAALRETSGCMLPRLVFDFHRCDIAINYKKRNTYLVFTLVPGTEILNPLEYPVLSDKGVFCHANERLGKHLRVGAGCQWNQPCD